jgi:hypothetical protein
MPFPTPSTGATLPGHHGPNHYDKYRGSLNDHNSVWAPFKSEIDWRVAQWAKLQGPSSTAVSELLSINGVRVLHFCVDRKYLTQVFDTVSPTSLSMRSACHTRTQKN